MGYSNRQPVCLRSHGPVLLGIFVLLPVRVARPGCVSALTVHRPVDGRPKGQECDGNDKSEQTKAMASGACGA